MKFNLCGRQRVLLRHNKITFCHRHFRFIILNLRQFHNLHDMIRDRKNLRIRSYPLGDNLWIYQEKDSFCLTTPDAYFLFHRQSWHRYIRQVHPRIRHILRRHGGASNYECDADDEAEDRPQPRRLAHYSRRQTLSRSSRNAIAEAKQWQKRPTLSRWDPSNHRRPLLSRGGEDATGDSAQTMSVDGDTASDFEHGSDYSITEPETAND